MSDKVIHQRPYEHLSDSALRAHYDSVTDQGVAIADEIGVRRESCPYAKKIDAALHDITGHISMVSDINFQSLVTAWSTHGGLISAELARRASQRGQHNADGSLRPGANNDAGGPNFADMLKAHIWAEGPSPGDDGPSPGDEVLIRATVHSNDGKTVWFLTGGADDPECSVSCVPIMRVISATPPWKPAAAEDWAGPSTTSGFDRLLRVNTGPEMAVHSGPRMWVPKEDGPILARLLKDIAEEPDEPPATVDEPEPPEDFSMFSIEQLARAREGEIAQFEEFMLMRGLNPLRAARITLRDIRMLDGLIKQRTADQ